jgi:hypothetical protein
LPKPSGVHNQQELMVETYPIDIAPEQVVRWLMVKALIAKLTPLTPNGGRSSS